MLPEISEIKKRRLRLALNQNGLARAAGVSQSLIAKTEAGRINPSYDVAKKIFSALDHHEQKEEKTARDIMTRQLILAKKHSTLREVARMMKKHGISQLPVAEGSRIIGSISEKAIMDYIGNGGDVSNLRAGKIMEDSFPTISETAPMSVIKSLLMHSHAIVVLKNTKPAGIITKSDLLKMAR